MLKDPQTVSRELARERRGWKLERRIRELGEALGVQIEEERVLKAANKRQSRAIGAAKRQGRDFSDAMACMRRNSEKLKRVSASIEGLLDEIVQLADVGSTRAPTESIGGHRTDRPTRFDAEFGFDDRGTVAARICSLTNDAAWDAYVDSHLSATAYHASAWRPLIERNFGHDGHYLTALDASERVVGVLPLVHLESRLFGSFLVSMPYVNYGGPLADSAAVARQLLERAGQLAMDLGCSHAEIRECHPRHDWTARRHKVAMIRPLPETAEQLDRELGSRVRAQVKRSLDARPAIAFGREELLQSFYAVFSRNMRDLGTPVYGIGFFRDMLATFPATFLSVVTIAGRPAAAGFLFGHRDTLEIPWASSLRSLNPLGVNMFMYRSVLDEAQRRGFRYFDFGRSTEGSATFRFKKQWGAKPQRLHWHYWLAEGESAPTLDPDNPKYRLAIQCWKRLPVRLTTLLGPPIVRNLP